ncbi:O-antigen ligase domain-containing protein [Paenibacillus psychroresistens]|uniref:O-antigen ligase domain-containing protein n=1 Tax=Paenibacillus psychroresistens TaxID=1778678 RepID=A0A6B8RN10_9BACL|nr:O-antigen ligase family protein [Paenibacillus psychroresistens]QGQ97227.1 O-antigen ligase domain-containing protein [Paenibacillus psychroresistens]
MALLQYRLKRYPLTSIFLYICTALIVGVSVIYQPILSIAAVCSLIIGAIAVRNPDWISYGVLLTTAISINYLITGTLFGIEILSLYKLCILLLLVPSMLVNGIRFKFGYPIAALLVMVFITFCFSNWLPLFSGSLAIKAFIGLSLPFFFLMIQWKEGVAKRHIYLICLLPMVSIVVGFMLQAVHLYSFLDVEFTGAVRVQGANIPPHLAMLACLGVAIPLIELKRSPGKAIYWYGLIGINFMILVATGTRGPILSLLFIVGYFIYNMIKQFLQGKAMLIIPLLGLVLFISATVYVQLDNLEKRSFDRATESGIDLSGRTEAWTYFLERVEDYPWSGRGLGSVTIANDGSLYKGFVVPHNEYIRFYFDTGYIGCGLLFISLILVFIRINRVLAKSIKPYYAAFILMFLVYSFSDNTLSTVQFIIPFCWYLNCLYLVSKSSDRLQTAFVQKEVML